MTTTRAAERGFTMLEVLIAILLSSVGMIGIVALFRVQTAASSFSRRTTEASVLATDQLERVRTIPIPAAGSGSSQTSLDESGTVVTDGVFARTWTAVPVTDYFAVTVTVSWKDNGQRSLVLRGRRNP
ncbi:MAG: prepilin-type N-terminal cleavage/methylation domain-containing protein [Kofleriaceae bacterium]